MKPLSKETIAEIRRLHMESVSGADIALHLGVSPSAVCRQIQGLNKACPACGQSLPPRRVFAICAAPRS